MSQWRDLRGSGYIEPAREKEVLILGAGASFDEKLADQKGLLSAIKAFCLSPSGSPAWTDSTRLTREWKDVESYLEAVFPGTILDEIRLEDCLTIFDIAVHRGEVVGGKGPRNLDRLDQSFRYCLLSYFRARTAETAGDHSTPMARLGKFLTERAKVERDGHAIISFNWDISLDRAIFGSEGTEYPPIDYCTYSVPWAGPGGERQDIPSIWKRPLNHPAVKVLKPHGSMNWLWCPTCDRLAVSPDAVIAWHGAARGADKAAGDTRIEQGRYCARCATGRDESKTPLLREVLITPTMTKDLSMTHLRMTWHNAFRELSEATRVTIIGYSLPDADFEFRYLLAKALAANPRQVKVRIVGAPENPSDPIPGKVKAAQERAYRALLGRARLLDPDQPIERIGVEAAVNAIVGTN